MPMVFDWISVRFGKLGGGYAITFFKYFLTLFKAFSGAAWKEILQNTDNFFFWRAVVLSHLGSRDVFVWEGTFSLLKSFSTGGDLCTPEFFSHNVRSDINPGGFFAVLSAAHAGRGCFTPGCWGGLSGATGSRDPQGCAGAREVSDPAVTNTNQRKKQNKSRNSLRLKGTNLWEQQWWRYGQAGWVRG